MSRTLCMSFCVFLNILLAKSLTYTPVIKIASGSVRGLILKTIENVDYAAFKGIPYAKPPVSDSRFKPPVEVDAWTKVYNAISEGSMCTQYNSTDNSVVGSEDCLYMDVFTPHTQFNSSIKKPVMVWIYGGAFVGGFSNQSYYGPDYILGEDVIMVSFNYRVSALGFLNLQHENATGNAGLKDQNLALKWVKKNIAQFGGDPDKITVFGHSAGSASVDYQVLSDMSAGLFSQSISMSGSSLCFYGNFQTGVAAVQNAFILGSKLGINTFSKDTLLKFLYNSSAADIITAAHKMDRLRFLPSLEKTDIAKDEEKFLTECSVNKYRSGNYTKGPHMLGFTANETVFAASIFENLIKISESLVGSTTKFDKSTLKNLIENATNNGKIKSDFADDSIYKLIEETTDLFFILPIDTKQKLISGNNNYPIYYYSFSFDSNYSSHRTQGINLDGVAHGDDLPYIFHMPVAKLPLNDSDIRSTRQKMVKLWTNFAKYGNPTPDREDNEVLKITWPDSRPSGEHLNIGKDLTTGPRPVSDFVKVMQLYGFGDSLALNDCDHDKHYVLSKIKSPKYS